MYEDEEKLVELLEELDVRISKKGNINLVDFVENVMKSKNSESYIKKLKNYQSITINDKEYIRPCDCIDILKKTNFKVCKNLYSKILVDDEYGPNVFDVENKIFKFNGEFIGILFVNDDYWIRGSQIAKLLKYSDPDQPIRELVSHENKFKFKKLREMYDEINNCDLKKIHRDTIFINSNGLVELLQKLNKFNVVSMFNLLGFNNHHKFLKKEQEIVKELDDFCEISNITSTHSFSVSRPNKGKYVIDYYLIDYKIAIEID